MLIVVKVISSNGEKGPTEITSLIERVCKINAPYRGLENNQGGFCGKKYVWELFEKKCISWNVVNIKHWNFMSI